MLHSSDRWKKTYPGAVVGLLAMSQVSNPEEHPALKQRKEALQAELRQRYAGLDRAGLRALPILQAYHTYYKRFDKTYHVLLQVESIVLKGKDLPDVSPLVDANFTAEVNTFVLTAGHDVAKLESPIRIDVSLPGDEISPMHGERKPIRAGDMVMRDSHGVCCTILYGQDNRSPITIDTQGVLYVAYVPPGVPVEAVEAQLQQIEQNIRLFAPQAKVEQRKLLAA